MRITTLVRLAVVATLLAGVGAAGANAQSVDKGTFFEFNGPVAVPGVTLPAGRYMFRVAATTQRDVLQVLSADGATSYAEFFALRALPDRIRRRFLNFGSWKPDRASRAAVKTWWYPSDLVGYEFIYPKAQARLLAEGTGEPVLTTRGEVVMEPPLDLTMIGPRGEERAAAEAPPFHARAAGGDREDAPEEPLVEARTQLPATASATMLIGFVGVALLLGTALLGTARRR